MLAAAVDAAIAEEPKPINAVWVQRFDIENTEPKKLVGSPIFKRFIITLFFGFCSFSDNFNSSVLFKRKIIRRT